MRSYVLRMSKDGHDSERGSVSGRGTEKAEEEGLDQLEGRADASQARWHRSSFSRPGEGGRRFSAFEQESETAKVIEWFSITGEGPKR